MHSVRNDICTWAKGRSLPLAGTQAFRSSKTKTHFGNSFPWAANFNLAVPITSFQHLLFSWLMDWPFWEGKCLFWAFLFALVGFFFLLELPKAFRYENQNKVTFEHPCARAAIHSLQQGETSPSWPLSAFLFYSQVILKNCTWASKCRGTKAFTQPDAMTSFKRLLKS